MTKKRLIYFLITILVVSFCSSILFAAEKDFQEKNSTHFIICYKNNVPREFVDDIIESAEGYYQEIADNLGFRRYNFWLWDDRAKIYIFPEKASYQKETGQPDWSGGCASYQQKKIWTYPHAAGFFDSILPHELGHIIFSEFVGFKSNIPLWFEEGIASYQEKSKRYAAINTVKELLPKNKLLTMEQLAAIKEAHNLSTSESADVFYTQSVSIIYFLINDLGSYKFSTLCERLKENKSLDKALEDTYYNIHNTGDLYKKWIDYLKRK